MSKRYGFRLKRIKKQETAADRAEINKRNEVAAIVIKEIEIKFPIININNFKEADEFRIKRTKELMDI